MTGEPQTEGAAPAPVVIELDRGTPTPIELSVHPTTDTAAPAILVSPAMGMRASFYRPLLTALAAAGVHAGVVELRGHQRRPAPSPGRRHDFGYADLAGDLAAAVVATRERWPRAAVTTLGHSFGGHVATAHVALHRGARDPARPDAVALVATGSVGWRTWGRIGPWHLLRSQALLALTTALGHFPGDKVGFAGREARTQMSEWARWARTGALRVGDPVRTVDHLVADLRLPVLAVSFARDPLAPASTTDALAGLYRAATVTRRDLDPGLERPHFDWVRDPEPIVPLLVDWARSRR